MQFAWKRFWLERGGAISFLDQGFMYDPDGEGGNDINPGLAPLTIKERRSCTVLLGEPGMGKSSEIALLEKEVPSTDSILFFNLRRFGDESRLIKSVFEAQELLNWKQGNGKLHLFLDSLDECLLRIDSVVTIIADELDRLAPYVDRLRFCIACRTAPWSVFLEQKLTDLFGKDFVEILEIAPLRKCDVRLAAEQIGISDPEEFMRGIVSTGIVALAMKPVTLQFLISNWRKRGSFPTNILDLYREGCRRLCEEDSDERRASPLLQVDSTDRFKIASGIAALTQIGNRFAIWTGRSSGEIPDEDVPLHELAGGESQGIRITEDAIRKTLDTGLFSSRGGERIGWAHLTYAEFLAGEFCNSQHLSMSQLRTLLFHPSGTGLIPQLAEVASWAALENPTLLSAIAREDPEVLLNAGLEGISDQQKESIVEGLLSHCRGGKYLHFNNWGRAGAYSKLKHSGLAAQLRTELSRPDGNLQVRYMAISLGHACKESDLCDCALQIALDDSESLGLRQLCVSAVSDLASISQRKSLEPLLDREKSNTRLKAYVIEALWPHVIDTEQVLALLPAWKSHLDMLSSFIHGRFIPALGRNDLIHALIWAQLDKETQGTHASLTMAIFELAWNHIEDTEIGLLLADTVTCKLGVYGWFATSSRDRDFQKLLDSDEMRRRILVRALLSRLNVTDTSLLHFPIRLANTNDVLWLLELFNSLSEPEQEVATNFIRFARDVTSTAQMDALWRGCQQFPTLAAACQGLFEPIPLDADWVKYEREASQRKRIIDVVLEPSPAQRLIDALHVAEAENADAWLSVVEQMTLEPASTHYGFSHEASVLGMPGWQSSDEHTRERIVEAAKRYLQSSTFFASTWPAGGGILHGALGAVQALWLCLQRESSFADANPFLLEKCILSVVRFHASSKESPLVQQELLRRLAIRSQDAINGALIEEICQNNDRHGYYMTREMVQTVWTTKLGEELVCLLQAERFKPSVTTPLLAHLFELSPESAREFASSALSAANAESLKRDHLRAIAVGWMHGEPKSGWESLWPLMRQDDEFGTYMVNHLGGSIGVPARFLSVIDVEALANFYIWMVARYPYPSEEDEEDTGPKPVNLQHHLRDISLEQIKHRKSFEAVAAIRRLMDTFPQHSWLRFHLDQADLLARAGTWEPFTIKELRMVTVDSSRLVGSERDLLLVLRESLDRLQERLRGETPTVRFLWNVNDNGVRPKGEEDLSDYIKDHLVTDIGARGIVVNREVQIRRANPGGVPGQRTDIQVSALPCADSAVRPISVIVEVKGCWNAGVQTAMRTQLHDRYLLENVTRTGLYVVGWYAAPTWDESDQRKRSCFGLGIDALRAELEHRAVELSETARIDVVILNCSLE